MSASYHWNTDDEIEVMEHMVAATHMPSPDGKGRPYTRADRLKKLKVWLAKSLIRRWDRCVNVGKCQEHANKLLRELGE